MEIMTAEDRVQRAWAKLTFGPGWEKRLSALMVEEIEAAVAEALTSADPQFLPSTAAPDAAVDNLISVCKDVRRFLWLLYRDSGKDPHDLAYVVLGELNTALQEVRPKPPRRRA